MGGGGACFCWGLAGEWLKAAVGEQASKAACLWPASAPALACSQGKGRALMVLHAEGECDAAEEL